FTPLAGCFSPFPHGTSSLSVIRRYLALRGGPRRFRPGFPCPAVLRCDYRKSSNFRVRGLYPLWRRFPPASASSNFCNFPTALWHDHESSYNPAPATPTGYRSGTVWADPVSLATTQGIEVSFLSSGY